MAGPPPSYDFDFVTIGAPNNPAYDGSLGPGNEGRGSVGYEYRMARTEVTSAQWLEFVNLMAPQSGNPFLFGFPTASGLLPVGLGRYELFPGDPNAGIRPVFGITWREAALYCNWLNNGKPQAWSEIQDGAYDASTFTTNPDGTFNDQATRSPGAQFWIPSLDEWIKAAHYDPDRNGENEGGWWRYSHTSDDAPISGPPGEGQTSAGYRMPDGSELEIPLGAYPDTRSPWGLLDVSGGAAEWTESWTDLSTGARTRWYDGTVAGDLLPAYDEINSSEIAFPTTRGLLGLRIAAAVPTPGWTPVILMLIWNTTTRRRSKQ